MMEKKIVITGAPGTGKTSIINQLKKLGHSCSNEISRELIVQQLAIGGNILPWKNQIAFENQIANKRYKQYLDSPENCICFFDRSSIDCIAYLNLNKLESTSQIIDIIKKCNFNKTVFYTPIWEEIYVNDTERKENIEQAINIEKEIIFAYKSFGHSLIPIPKLHINERADFILSKI